MLYCSWSLQCPPFVLHWLGRGCRVTPPTKPSISRYQPKCNSTACRIAVYRPGTIDEDPERLEEIREWAIEWLLAFKRVFEPELDELLK